MNGATALHLCAERNLARPVRMLVDSGADVNAKHETSKLTPLQMACKHAHPDVETIRSFLDKGAYPNWKGDLDGKSAFEIIIGEQSRYMIGSLKTNSFDTRDDGDDDEVGMRVRGRSSFGGKSINSDGDGFGYAIPGPDGNSSFMTPPGTPNSSKHGSDSLVSANNPPGSGSRMGNMLTSKYSASANKNNFRNTKEAVDQVGEWAVEALPTLLEIAKRGGRFDPTVQELDSLRPSFRAAIMEARAIWEKAGVQSQSTGAGIASTTKFLEFLTAREQAGESIVCDKEHWCKDDSSPHCLLCAGWI